MAQDQPQSLPKQTLERQLAMAEHDIWMLADAMPVSNYLFAPAEGMRTFAEQVKHLATVVYLAMAVTRKEQSPYAPGDGNNGPPEVQSKEEVLQYAKDAFAYARRTMGAWDEAGAAGIVPTYFGPQSRAEVASGILHHSYNHYGQMVVYARLCGIVPPTSVPA